LAGCHVATDPRTPVPHIRQCHGVPDIEVHPVQTHTLPRRRGESRLSHFHRGVPARCSGGSYFGHNPNTREVGTLLKNIYDTIE